MDTEVATLDPDTDILEAAGFLLDKHVTGAPVVEEGDMLVGILTEKDLMKVLAQGVGGERAKGTVRDFMTAHPVTATPRMDIYYAAGLFLSHDFRRLPVVQDGRRLVGAITRFDLLRAIRKHYVT